MTKDALQAEQFRALLTEEVYRAAWRYALRLSANGQDAEDLLQDAMAHGYLKFSQLRNHGAFKSWLLSIIHSIYIRQWRNERRRLDTADEKLEAQPSPARTQDMTDLSAGLLKLPESQRELLSLFYIDGLSLKETGQVLKIPARAVKQRLFRARNALHRHLEPHYAVGDMSTLF